MKRYANHLYFGPPGHGKTVLIGTAAQDERTAPILILDFEGGTDSLAGMPGEGTDWVVAHVRNWQDYNTEFARLQANDEGFKSTGVDSAAETHIGALLTILDDEAGRRKDKDALQIQDYGKAMIQMRRFVREFRDLPMHVFFTAHSKEETDPREGRITVPSFSGKMAYEIPGMLSLSGYLALATNDEGETYRSLLLNNYAKIRTKVRMPYGVPPPDEIDNPTITSIFDALGFDE
jgi:hypothetical protein